MTTEVELVGGPLDGLRYACDAEQPILIVAQPVYMPALMLNSDPMMASVETIPIIEHAYVRDHACPWRYIHAGERQKQ